MLTEHPQAFHRALVAVNSLEKTGFAEWLFLPSMLFGSREKWWDGGGVRDAVHEGIDIFMYRTADGSIRYLDASFKIPAIAGGTVETIIDDFLGRSVFVSHVSPDGTGDRIFSVYGHTAPSPSTVPGMDIREGDIIGTIAESTRSSVRSHLHISFMRIPDSIHPDELDWDLINRNESITLTDPFDIIDLPHSVIDPSD